ncbi:MAG: hypothetical protein AAFO91_10695 [Bacteroidota bacterium]
MKRIIASIVIIFLAVSVSPLILLPLAVLHAFSWFALELVIIGALIDAYFGGVQLMPYYTLAAMGLVAIAEWLKPRLLMYVQE